MHFWKKFIHFYPLEKIFRFFFSRWLFFKSTLSVLRCTWTGWINLKIFLGYDINYLSIWPFMCHPWFPTRKASKLTFVFFQHQVLNTLQGQVCKPKNVSLEDFIVGNQGWHIKRQMLRYRISSYKTLPWLIPAL